MNSTVNLQYNLNFQKSNRVSKNSLKELSVSLRYSINRYDTALYNLLLFQTGRQDLVTFFPFASQLTVQTASSTFYQHKKKKTKGREKKEKEREICKQRDVTLRRRLSSSTRCLKGYLVLCELDFVDCARLKNSEAAFIAEEPIS